jgi:hypothetical protein
MVERGEQGARGGGRDFDMKIFGIEKGRGALTGERDCKNGIN